MNKKQINMIVKVIMDNSSDNPYRRTIQKINKVGKNRLRGAELEDIEAYSYLLVVEYLSKVSIDEWNSMADDKLREKDLLSYCYNRLKKLSKSEGINTGISCCYNKDKGKYEYRYLNNINIDDIELSNDSNLSINSSTLTHYIFDTYINLTYLTEHQLRYVNTVVSNYVDDGGNVRDIITNEVLYTKQASYKHRRTIREKLEPLIDKDTNIKINSNGRWIIK